MFAYASVLAAILAASGVAAHDFNPGFPVPGSPVRHIAPRQTVDLLGGDDSMGKCIDAVLEAAAGAPFPPSDILEWMTGTYYVTHTGAPAVQTDACLPFVQDIPGSLVNEWKDYQSEVMDWYKDHSAEVSKALTNCPSTYSSSVGPCTKTPTAAPVGGSSKGSSGCGGSGGSKGSGAGSTASPAGYLAVVTVGLAALLGAAMMM
jgi:hypothetical protein